MRETLSKQSIGRLPQARAPQHGLKRIHGEFGLSTTPVYRLISLDAVERAHNVMELCSDGNFVHGDVRKDAVFRTSF
jgi:hypothetical protein